MIRRGFGKPHVAHEHRFPVGPAACLGCCFVGVLCQGRLCGKADWLCSAFSWLLEVEQVPVVQASCEDQEFADTLGRRHRQVFSFLQQLFVWFYHELYCVCLDYPEWIVLFSGNCFRQLRWRSITFTSAFKSCVTISEKKWTLLIGEDQVAKAPPVKKRAIAKRIGSIEEFQSFLKFIRCFRQSRGVSGKFARRRGVWLFALSQLRSAAAPA